METTIAPCIALLFSASLGNRIELDLVFLGAQFLSRVGIPEKHGKQIG